MVYISMDFSHNLTLANVLDERALTHTHTQITFSI